MRKTSVSRTVGSSAFTSSGLASTGLAGSSAFTSAGLTSGAFTSALGSGAGASTLGAGAGSGFTSTLGSGLTSFTSLALGFASTLGSDCGAGFTSALAVGSALGCRSAIFPLILSPMRRSSGIEVSIYWDLTGFSSSTFSDLGVGAGFSSAGLLTALEPSSLSRRSVIFARSRPRPCSAMSCSAI